MSITPSTKNCVLFTVLLTLKSLFSRWSRLSLLQQRTLYCSQSSLSYILCCLAEVVCYSLNNKRCTVHCLLDPEVSVVSLKSSVTSLTNCPVLFTFFLSLVHSLLSRWSRLSFLQQRTLYCSLSFWPWSLCCLAEIVCISVTNNLYRSLSFWPWSLCFLAEAVCHSFNKELCTVHCLLGRAFSVVSLK